MAKILFKAGKIFDGEEFIVGDLLFENDKIVAIDTCIRSEEAMEIDCSGCILSSGLIDIHTHLLEMGNKQFGFPADMATIPFGVTYAVDACAENTNTDILEKLCVETKVFIPIRIKGGTLDRDEMQKSLKLYGDRAIGIKVYFDESLNNGTTYEIFRETCEFARNEKRKVMVHCSYSPTPMLAVVKLLQKGDIVTHAYHGGYHTIAEKDYIAYKTAKEKGVVIDAGMAGGVHTDFEILRKAIEKGYIPDTISSDITCFSAYMRGGVYGLPMCMSIMKMLGMDEKQIFQAVTKNAARAVGEETWQGLKIGNAATMSVMKWEKGSIDIKDRAENRIQSGQGYVCKMTVKNGKIVYRN